MLTTILISLIYSIAFSTLLAITPLHLRFIILLFAITSAIWFAIYSSSWFALTIFIVYVGGILVIFAYFVAISPNYNISLTPLLITFSISLTLLFIILSSLKVLPITFTKENSHIIISFPFFPIQGPILIFLILILFLAIVFVVKIARRNSGPLRPFST